MLSYFAKIRKGDTVAYGAEKKGGFLVRMNKLLFVKPLDREKIRCYDKVKLRERSEFHVE
jgi:hypothetical protein